MTTQSQADPPRADDAPDQDGTTNGRRDAGRGAKRLVIVESPAKARTIARYLGPDYVVESSVGHIRDLPSTATEIPAKYKKEAWARLGVDVDHDFAPLYVVPGKKKDVVKKLKDELKGASEVYLATDEDREGEAIAWHLREVLNPSVPVRRMVFHEITQSAIEQALANPREVDERLVAAQEARRIVDRLVGYEVSPVLWRKVKPRLSAGRVQSAAIRLVVERERARMRFTSAGYWDVAAGFRAAGADTFEAPMIDLDGSRLASGRDFDPETGRLAERSNATLLDEQRAQAIARALEGRTASVASVEERPYTQRPPGPFITSTLQQEAARKLRFSAQRTMSVAQRLYENGYITYMRTDSTNLSEQAVTAARRQASNLYGAEYVPEQPRRYASTSKGAQEAHEAIRPAGEIFRTPETLRRELDDDGFRLYDLIWKRTVASQMRDATGMRTQVRIEAKFATNDTAAPTQETAGFQVSGKVITFPGFLRAYVEGSDDPDAELEDQERLLPPLREGQELAIESSEARGHETQPPARWTEASLIKELEELGIGRPSTYASILQTIEERGYVWKKSNALVPTFIAFAVVQLLEEHFPDLVDYEFTARMEQSLDAVAEGELEARPWLSRFYFGDPNADGDSSDLVRAGLRESIGSGWEEIDARAISSIPLGKDDHGNEVAVRVGRYGAYVQAGDGDLRADIPDDAAPDEIKLEDALRLLHQESLGDQVVGHEPESGDPIYLKTGRYGPYVQVGEDQDPRDKKAPKPKRASLWPTMAMESLTEADALKVLAYPRSLGKHPVTGLEITAQDGPRGPYVRMGDEYRSLEDHAHLERVTLEDAVELFAQERKFGRPRGPQALAELGEHPATGDTITVRSGRFGPYVSDGTVNASLPKGRDPQSVTLEQALELIAAREEKLRAEGKDPRAKKPAGGRGRSTGARSTSRSSGTRRTSSGGNGRQRKSA